MYSTPLYSENHVVNPETGFLENPAHLNSFDSLRKQTFLRLFEENCLALYDTCQQLNLKTDTVHKHYAQDPVFRAAFDDVKKKYFDKLEVVSRTNALNPKSVVERIFQLNNGLPEKYGNWEKRSGTTNIVINFDPKSMDFASKREAAIDAEEIVSTLDQKQKNIESK